MEDRNQFISNIRRKVRSPYEIYSHPDSKRIKYRVTGATREEVDAKYKELLNEYRNKYGEYMVKDVNTCISFERDEQRRIVKRIRSGIFICYSPHKNDIEKTEKSENIK